MNKSPKFWFMILRKQNLASLWSVLLLMFQNYGLFEFSVEHYHILRPIFDPVLNFRPNHGSLDSWEAAAFLGFEWNVRLRISKIWIKREFRRFWRFHSCWNSVLRWDLRRLNSDIYLDSRARSRNLKLRIKWLFE